MLIRAAGTVLAWAIVSALALTIVLAWLYWVWSGASVWWLVGGPVMALFLALAVNSRS